MGEEALELARACAVLGDECALSVAARLAKLDVAAAIAAAERLVVAEILAGTDRLSFAHPMIRSAVYGELPPGERPRAHAAASALLHAEGAPADDVARHLLAGTPTDEPWACTALHEGARAAARKGRRRRRCGTSDVPSRSARPASAAVRCSSTWGWSKPPPARRRH
jgi:hypothetical protein